MALNRPTLSRSPASRTSFMSVGRMPVIDEHEEVRTQPSTLTASMSAPSLRAPQKSYRRSAARGLPPPYVPATYLPSYQYQYQLSKEAERGIDKRNGGWFANSLDNLREWYLDRKRSCRSVALLGLLVVAIIVGLAVGLTVGLRNRGGGDDGSDSDTRPTIFPTGSYTFNTTLQRTSTACTSSSNTWRCYPYEQGGSAGFFWTITEDAGSSFNISSTDNPFAPSFSNMSMEILDGNQPTERLIFSFSMNKTVVPSGGVTPGNRAARCTFDDTTFEAILWTRRRNGETIDFPQQTSSNFDAWPGDVEIAQVKESTLGSPPLCEDNAGTAIADVQAAAGECECRYASFELD